jgi:NAD(P)H-hydrate repair Nnr-like enzyme with NAD(P)H-hydrate epimerase domain
VRVSMDVRRRMRGLRAHCDQEDKGGDGLLCARHVGRPVYISVMFLLLFRKVFFKWK